MPWCKERTVIYSCGRYVFSTWSIYLFAEQTVIDRRARRALGYTHQRGLMYKSAQFALNVDQTLKTSSIFSHPLSSYSPSVYRGGAHALLKCRLEIFTIVPTPH